MNLVLWILSLLAAAAFVGAGVMKLATPKLKLDSDMAWAASWPASAVRLLALAEILGAIGLVVPWWVKVLPILTPIAAACLAVLMLGAIGTHAKLKEPQRAVPSVLLLVITATIAIGRFGQL
ncbi:MAG: DoxX family protein [Deltaproteobacteria bacterium]